MNLYIKQCFFSPIINIGFVLFIIVLACIKHIKLTKKGKIMYVSLVAILLLPSVFLDLRFYHQFSTNPEIEDVIEIDNVVSMRLKPKSNYIVGGRAITECQFVRTVNGEEFLLEKRMNYDEYEHINNKENNEILKDLVEKGELQAMSNEDADTLDKSNKYKIKYIKTDRYNVITRIRNIED